MVYFSFLGSGATTPKLSEEEEAKTAEEKLARAEARAQAMIRALEGPMVPECMAEQISACVHKSSAEVYASVNNKCDATKKTLKLFEQRLETTEALGPALKKETQEAVLTVKQEIMGLVETDVERRSSAFLAQMQNQLTTIQQTIIDNNETRYGKHREAVAARFKKRREVETKLGNELAALTATVNRQNEEKEALRRELAAVRGELAELKASANQPRGAENEEPRDALALVQPSVATASDDETAKLREEIRRLREDYEKLASDHKTTTVRHDESLQLFQASVNDCRSDCSTAAETAAALERRMNDAHHALVPRMEGVESAGESLGSFDILLDSDDIDWSKTHFVVRNLAAQLAGVERMLASRDGHSFQGGLRDGLGGDEVPELHPEALPPRGDQRARLLAGALPTSTSPAAPPHSGASAPLGLSGELAATSGTVPASTTGTTTAQGLGGEPAAPPFPKASATFAGTPTAQGLGGEPTAPPRPNASATFAPAEAHTQPPRRRERAARNAHVSPTSATASASFLSPNQAAVQLPPMPTMVTTPVPPSIPVAALGEADTRDKIKADIRAKPWPDAVLEHWGLGPTKCFEALGIPYTKYPKFGKNAVYLCQSCSRCRNNLPGAWATTYKDPSNAGQFHPMGTRLPKGAKQRFLAHLAKQDDEGAVVVIPKEAL